MRLTSTAEDIRQLERIETEMALQMRKYRSNTEPGIIAIALVRGARALLTLYDMQERADLVEMCCAFLRGEATPADDPAARILTMQ
jgi:hypothetical protein